MKKFNVAGASFRTEKIDFVLEKYYKDKSKQNSDSYFVDNQPQKYLEKHMSEKYLESDVLLSE